MTKYFFQLVRGGQYVCHGLASILHKIISREFFFPLEKMYENETQVSIFSERFFDEFMLHLWAILSSIFIGQLWL
jgi:hypothetical protein